MSHTHEDRIADRPPHLCAAYGCLLIGTSTASTTGSSEWYCFAHFGAEVGRYQAITRELNALSWLSAAARDIRFHDKPSADSKAAFALIEHEFALNERKDLLWNRVETRKQWLERIEGEIRTRLHEVMQPAQQQALAIDKSQSTGNFAKVGFDMPA